MRSHPWNLDPLPLLPPRPYRLLIETPPGKDDRKFALVATSESIQSLLDLAVQCARLGYEFEKLERVDGSPGWFKGARGTV